MISTDDFLFFLDAALDSMIAVVADLGDELANRKPDVPRANTPYAILRHCLGVMEYWGGHAIAGRPFERDRPAEFVSGGPVGELVAMARRQRAQLDEDLSSFSADDPPRGVLPDEDRSQPVGRTQGGVLLHVYEELSQHLGQMEISRDVLRAEWVRLA